MKAKDLQLELLQWYLRLKKFNFVVCDIATVRILTDSEQAQKNGRGLDLERALLGRQPKSFFLFLSLIFIIFVVFLYNLEKNEGI